MSEPWSQHGLIGGFIIYVAGLVALTLIFDVLQERCVSNLARRGRTARGSLVLPAGTIGDDAEDMHTYTAYRRSPVGYLFMMLWTFAYLLSQGLMVAFCWSMKIACDECEQRSGELGPRLSEPFLSVFLLSAIVTTLSRRCPQVQKCCFGCIAEPQDADLVVVKAGGNYFRCPVVAHNNYPSFEFMCFRFVYIEQDGGFCFAGKETLRTPLLEERLRMQGLSPGAALQRQLLAGENVINVHVPGILASLFEEFHTMMYIYQLHCIWWYFFTDRWNTSSVWLAIVVTSGVVKALFITRWNRLRIKALASDRLRTEVQVFRDRRLRKRSSKMLVPGDLILLASGDTVPCDCTLVRGGALVHEAMLTGEPMPVTKLAIELNRRAYSEATAKTEDHDIGNNASVLFGGSEILEAHSDGEEGAEGALAVVQAIGGATLQANLIRLVLFQREGHFKHFSKVLHVYFVMITYALTLSFVLCIFVSSHFEQYHLGFADLCVHGVSFMFPIFNPMLGVTMVIGQLLAGSRLKHKGIHCLTPQRIPMAGCIDTMVLDKTGTITEDSMELNSVVQTCPDGSMGGPVPVARLGEMSLIMRCLIKSCCRLSLLEGDLVIDHDEVKTFALNSRATIRNSSASSRYSRYFTERQSQAPEDRFHVLRVLNFSHDRMTSGCVCKMPDDELYVLVKGSASHIGSLAEDAPANFVSTADEWSARCYYVLACGFKRLSGMEEALADRDALERGIRACGLLLFKNPIRPGSTEAIANLREAGIGCVLCTGDHVLSGVGVAKNVGLIPKDQPVYQVSGFGMNISVAKLDSPETPVCTFTAESPVAIEDSTVAVLTSGAFAVEQRDWEKLIHNPMLPFVLPRIRVFGRMRPEGKVSVVQTYQRLGHQVGMCGDGGNDCGAMRAAQVGLALSAGDGSIVAPFSSVDRKGLESISDLVKVGRACMATNMACFCYYISYGLACVQLKFALFLFNGGNLSEWQWLFIDLILSVGLPWAMACSVEVDTLTARRPTASLLSPCMLFQTGISHILFVVMLVIAWTTLRFQPWWMEWNPSTIGISGWVRNRRADNFESEVGFFALATHLAITGIVQSFGGRYRRPVFKNCLLILVYVFGVCTLIFLLFIRSTFISCLFRINCDSATSRDMDDDILGLMSTTVVRGCFLGPQMQRWGDNIGKVEPAERRLSVVALVKEARSRPKTCLPQPSTMDEQLVPEEFRDAAAINNTLSHEFGMLLLVIMVSYTVVMLLLHQYLSWSPAIEAMERRADEDRVSVEMPWLSPPRFSLCHGTPRSSCGSTAMSPAVSLELSRRLM